MAILRKLVSGLKVLFRSGTAEKELDEELTDYFEERLPLKFARAPLLNRHVAR